MAGVGKGHNSGKMDAIRWPEGMVLDGGEEEGSYAVAVLVADFDLQW